MRVSDKHLFVGLIPAGAGNTLQKMSGGGLGLIPAGAGNT